MDRIEALLGDVKKELTTYRSAITTGLVSGLKNHLTSLVDLAMQTSNKNVVSSMQSMSSGMSELNDEIKRLSTVTIDMAAESTMQHYPTIGLEILDENHAFNHNNNNSNNNNYNNRSNNNYRYNNNRSNRNNYNRNSRNSNNRNNRIIGNNNSNNNDKNNNGIEEERQQQTFPGILPDRTLNLKIDSLWLPDGRQRFS
ncbi:putative uncharacterized transmembrane protein DDB_G0292500 [Sabethes cyaneus]|uniref:putative uncharacterized transmembrane protein DDB_G0292500 n=1 Tax=Sabethes cyaneus TaxID=53552 RepID=UPI00237EE314|nr:putative uncharacterized transmembrane protein DDB_G0292500 [Sabethes cyaneus]